MFKKVLIEKLELYGFLQPFTNRIGPCDNCPKQNKRTWYIPSIQKWLCMYCAYKVDYHDI